MIFVNSFFKRLLGGGAAVSGSGTYETAEDGTQETAEDGTYQTWDDGGTSGGFVPANNAVVAKGGFMHLGLTSNPAGYTRSETRNILRFGRQPTKSIRLAFCNLYVTNGEINGTNDITVEAGIESISGTVQTVMMTFGGQPNVVISPGGYAVSDALYPSNFGLSVFPAGWTAYARSGLSVASGTYRWPFGGVQEAVTTSYCGSNVATSQTPNTGPFVVPPGGGTNGTYGYGPVVVLGEWASTPDVSVFISGDSISTGVGDNSDDGTTGGGYITRGLSWTLAILGRVWW